ncbi:MAG: hypothetical protein AAB365_00295 [Patescibacteria group bacterium]
MPYFRIPKTITVDGYVDTRFKLIKKLSPKALFRNGYADEFYPFPIVHSRKEIDTFVQVQRVLHKALTGIVENYFSDTDIQKRVPLAKEVATQLRRISSCPYRVGAIRPDYIYTKVGQPLLCEINARFIFNGFFMSIYMNEAFQSLFPMYSQMRGIQNLKNSMKERFGTQDVPVIKDREDGYDVHSFLLEYPSAQLFGVKDLKKILKKYPTVVLELHQDEVEKHLKVICDAIISGTTILNDPRTLFIVHDKRLLSVLSDVRIMRRYLTASETALLTGFVIPTYTSDTHPKIFSKAEKDRSKWVGKKAISGKADGLYIGKEKEPAVWKAILKRPDTLLQPYIVQKKFRFWDPLKRKVNEWYLAGVLPMWDDAFFGPGLYRVSHTHKHDFARFIQPMQEK